MEIGADFSAKMAVLAESLIMASNTVIGLLLRRYPMLGIPETQVGGRRAFGLVALVAFLDREVPVFRMRFDGRHDQTRAGQKAQQNQHERLSYQCDSSLALIWN
jgi:hypothetical protein